LALIVLSYAIAAPSFPSSTAGQEPSSTQRQSSAKHPLSEDCRSVAESLEESLPEGWGIVVYEPFVLAGDCREEQLHRHYRQTIAPTVRALSIQYFDHSPKWPITIVLCTSDDSYRECNRCLEKRQRNEYSGVYSRREHRVVVNVATGEGTLAHELTHALAHADFADMPEWLDEGMASLHEECEFSPDGFRLIGLENWRGAILRNAFAGGKLRSISALAKEQFASSDRATIDYAQARYFCLFLERHRVLEAFYRKCRQRNKADPDGLETLAELFETRDLRNVDKQFQEWVRRLKPRADSAGN
jgi:hypothetical protein